MAYLNVRERRIEAKIAYVGGELAGKATNLAWLGQSGRDGRIAKVDTSTDPPGALTLAWSPAERAVFRDCDVRVSLVAQHGGASEERYEEALRGVDGVVVVLDAHPSAQERNRASFDTVRDVLARSDRRGVPIVVQVNKTDLPGALGADEVIARLDAPAPRHVPAVAAQGTGVLETLEAALEEVLDALTSGANGEQAPGEGDPSADPSLHGSNGASDGGHPLLAALRQVLRDTMTEHARALEGRITARLEETLCRVERRVAATEALAGELRVQLEESAARARGESTAGAARLD
ncbi:MAG TPA: hypothetical protein VL400_27180, partial [Polyangiaceae bacterium]|nr:hypothetical protein [Polyangiaceae bacterium]